MFCVAVVVVEVEVWDGLGDWADVRVISSIIPNDQMDCLTAKNKLILYELAIALFMLDSCIICMGVPSQHSLMETNTSICNHIQFSLWCSYSSMQVS